jgi:hypothetical protein
MKIQLMQRGFNARWMTRGAIYARLYCGAARGLGLTDNACHVILQTVDPRLLSQMESQIVASNICQARRAGPGSARRRRGRAVQVDSIKTRVESAPNFSALKPKCDEALSNLAFKFNLRRYNAAGEALVHLLAACHLAPSRALSPSRSLPTLFEPSFLELNVIL